MSASALNKDAAIASVTLAPDQSVPLSFERLSLSKVRIPKTVTRRQVHYPVPATSLAEGFDNIEAPVPTLMTSGNCHVAPVPTQVDDLVMKVKCESSVLSSECRAPNRNLGEIGSLQENLSHSSHTPNGTSDEPTNVLTSISTNNGVDSSTIVIGEDVTGCVVVNLQGNMVVQEHPSTQAPSGSYLVDEQLLVQVTQEQEPENTQSNEPSNTSRMLDGNPSCGKGNKDDSIFNAAPRKDMSHKHREEKNVTSLNNKFSDGAKTKNQSNFESRWNFHKVFVKSECPLITKASPEDIMVEGENESEDIGRPRRKSARKARLRWKNTHDVDNIGKIGVKRSKCMHFLSRDKRGNKTEKPMVSTFLEIFVISVCIFPLFP